MKNIHLYYFLIILLSTSCVNKPQGPLPIIGHRDISPTGDTLYHQIPDFQFINQDNQSINNATFSNKAYVVDFFFMNCPTICPKVKKQMLRLYKRFKKEDKLILLSHSIDPKYDTVERLKQYATNLEVKTSKWHFVTGQKEDIYEIADDYFSVAKENPDAPGGFDHSGRLILIDKNRHVRAFCDGTDAAAVSEFMLQVEQLLGEMEVE